MVIYEFDVETRLDDLQKNLEYVEEIKNSISDKRESYRLFADNISIEFRSLQTCCDTFERNLLIDTYTFSEQLIKNFYYELIEKDRYENEYLKNFINEKVNADKFSPNVMFGNIEKNIQKELVSNFKFILRRDRIEVHIYDELVKSRHQYAHSGNYLFEYCNFGSAINVIKYLSVELKTVIDWNLEDRIKFQESMKKLKELSLELKKKIDKSNDFKNAEVKRLIKDKLKELRNHCIFIIDKYTVILSGCELLYEINEKIVDYSEADLRQFENSILKQRILCSAVDAYLV